MIDVFYYDGGVKRAKIEDVPGILGKKPLWVNITNISHEEAETVRKLFRLHPLSVEDFYSSESRIKVEEFKRYLFCVFYGIRKTNGIPEMVELDLILGKDFLISNHNSKMDTIEQLMADRPKLQALFERGVDFLFHKLLDDEVDNYFPVLETLDDEIEDLEEDVLRSPTAELLARIQRTKRSIVKVKRYVFRMRDKVSFLAKREYPFISNDALPYFRDIYDHIIQVADAADSHRDAVGSTFEIYMSAQNNSMNEVMKTLSIIATIALPLTAISGIYGMNFLNLPGSKEYFGFWAVIAVMLLVIFSMVLYFKRRRWF